MNTDEVSWSEWIAGSELVQRFVDSTVDRVVPRETPGVYLWSRRTVSPTATLASYLLFSAWLTKQMMRTVGTVDGTLKHIGSMTLDLGGAGDLTESKLDSLAALGATRPGREVLRNVVSGVSHATTLYVGEADDLCARVGEHLRLETGFAQRAMGSEGFGYEWPELALRFVKLPGSTKAERTTLERLLAILTLAPSTSRAG